MAWNAQQLELFKQQIVQQVKEAAKIVQTQEEGQKKPHGRGRTRMEVEFLECTAVMDRLVEAYAITSAEHTQLREYKEAHLSKHRYKSVMCRRKGCVYKLL